MLHKLRPWRDTVAVERALNFLAFGFRIISRLRNTTTALAEAVHDYHLKSDKRTTPTL